eukprot:10066780-Lingulodinium_polyedra.AAC.1
MRGPATGATVDRSVSATVTSSPMPRGAVETNARTWSRHCGQREWTHLAFASPGEASRGAG